jgi:hypothetical protein
MYEQMVNYVSRNGLFSSFQSGFRPDHCTASAIARVSVDICLNMESNQPTILVLLDFSKVFDRVAKDCSFLSCVSATAFMLYGSGTCLFLFRYQKVACGGTMFFL